ncbi:MaoC family dehydratase [Fodinicola feengrottensis]|uniref:3-hydroxyacyl-thioester dehydratase HtdZ n=1 Tax=Fodinicola feengrottensis TaxID=435914 RepID=A0ABN2GH08_9ACTN|nr:MaoC family dehydratase [Fodinicola feengrottensis]
MRTFGSIDEMRGAVGEQLGPGDWHPIGQQQINLFADATGDHQWIHVDIEKAKAGPFGGPIAHGFLTLSMLPLLVHEVYAVENVKMGINYGLNKVRFPSPVPVDSKVRATVTLASVDDIAGGVQVVAEVIVEAEGIAKPVCVAEFVTRVLV